MIKLYNFDELKPEEILNRDIRAEKNVEDVVDAIIADVRVLDYATNPDKTEYDALAQTLHYAENDAKTKLNESAQLVTGIHCRPDHAWEDMRAVQERFGKTDGVVALHAYQSFREEIGRASCRERV